MMTSLFTFSLEGLKCVMNVGKHSSYITLLMTLAFFIFFIIFVETSSFSLSTFGLTLDNWKRAIVEDIVFTVPFGIAILVLKWVLFILLYGKPLIEGIASMNDDPKTWRTFLLIHILIVAPFQEFSPGGVTGLFGGIPFIKIQFPSPSSLPIPSSVRCIYSCRLRLPLLVSIPCVHFVCFTPGRITCSVFGSLRTCRHDRAFHYWVLTQARPFTKVSAASWLFIVIRIPKSRG